MESCLLRKMRLRRFPDFKISKIKKSDHAERPVEEGTPRGVLQSITPSMD